FLRTNSYGACIRGRVGVAGFRRHARSHPTSAPCRANVVDRKRAAMRTTPKTPRALAPLLSALLLSCVASEVASATTGWLRTVGNRVYDEDGRVWAAVGANLLYTRSCNACTSGPPNVGEVKRRIDELVDVWGASFIRLDLESYGSSS